MRILGIETSCDETAAAVVEDAVRVKSNVIASSRQTFERTGGVIPEEAARKQLECMLPVIHTALKDATMTKDDIDCIAVTRGPGLLGSLLVGTSAARMLSLLWNKPLIGVHHTLGHLSSTWLETSPSDVPAFPMLTLSASGGHTELWLRTSPMQGQLVGRTRDDAAGEAFDKGATLLGLPYPGGPSIAKAAERGDAHTFDFPLPLKDEDSLDWNFSGLKTALRYVIRDTPDWQRGIADIAASYQFAICRHLIDRIAGALLMHPDVREVHLVGGVSANRKLREMTNEIVGDRRLRTPMTLAYCTDNAAMIAAAAELLVREQPSALGTPFATEASLALASAINTH